MQTNYPQAVRLAGEKVRDAAVLQQGNAKQSVLSASSAPPREQCAQMERLGGLERRGAEDSQWQPPHSAPLEN
ncbi:hypothetical protein V495_08204, partial [Pseudogymnoascus sp. VKM F-4514 (FW-929)]